MKFEPRSNQLISGALLDHNPVRATGEDVDRHHITMLGVYREARPSSWSSSRVLGFEGDGISRSQMDELPPVLHRVWWYERLNSLIERSSAWATS